MTISNIFPQLEIPNTLAAGPGPGNTDARVLARFASAGTGGQTMRLTGSPSPAKKVVL